jgi:hypothetical protein
VLLELILNHADKVNLSLLSGVVVVFVNESELPELNLNELSTA